LDAARHKAKVPDREARPSSENVFAARQEPSSAPQSCGVTALSAEAFQVMADFFTRRLKLQQ
jgi:hypothetical protein